MGRIEISNDVFLKKFRDISGGNLVARSIIFVSGEKIFLLNLLSDSEAVQESKLFKNRESITEGPLPFSNPNRELGVVLLFYQIFHGFTLFLKGT